MSSIDSTTSRSIFLPNKKENARIGSSKLHRNSETRKNELDTLARSDAKVDIPDSIKDFSKIKKIADAAPAIDNTDKIARLRSQIADGSYKVDPDILADKILEQEF